MNQGESARVPGGGQDEPEYTRAEYVTLAVSMLILLTLVGWLTYEYYITGAEPAVLTVEPQRDNLRRHENQYYLPVDVANRGDLTATDVWVRLELVTDAGVVDAAELFLPTLPGGATATVVAIFDQDPRAGELQSAVSFTEP